MSKPIRILTQPPESVEIVTVGRELAEQWLAKNTKNRNLRRQLVDRYARDMAAGNWYYTAEPIKFAKGGGLVDGQHRLAAVVQSGATVTFLVVWGLDEESQQAMDSGARRAPADFLSLGGHTNAAQIAAVARKMLQWEDGKPGSRSFRNYQPSTIEILQAFAKDKAVQEAAEIAQQYRRLIPVSGSVIGLCWWLFSSIDREQATFFFERLGSGANLPTGNPILTLKTRLSNIRSNTGVRIMEEQLVALFIRAWNAHREGRKATRFYAFGHDLDSFPEPK